MKIRKKLTTKKNKIFEPIPFKKMFFYFVIFSFIGCIYEDIYIMFRDYFRHGTWNLVTKRGLLYFELSPIYGLGACLMIYIFSKRNNSKFDYFWLGAFIGGSFEYIASYLQELFTGTVSWDYSEYFLNINGRTTIPYMLFWGLLCFVIMTKVYPFVERLVDKIPKNIFNRTFWIMFVVIMLDVFISYSACIRYGLRHEGHEPLTFYGEFLDKYYDDERIKISYTNIRHKD